MRILIATPTFPPFADGVAVATWQHAVAFASDGHRVIVATKHHPKRASEQPYPGILLREFRVGGSCNPLVGLSGECDLYRRFVLETPLDVAFFHCWQTWTTGLVFDLLPRLAYKRVMVSHGVSANVRYGWPRSIPAWLGWRPFVWWTLPNALRKFDRIVLLSDRVDRDRFLDGYLIRRLGLRNSLVIPNGADLDAHRSVRGGFRAEYGISQRLLLLCVGKYDELKNEQAVARAVLESGVSDAMLVLIGPEMNAYVERLRHRWKKTVPHDRNLRLLCLTGLDRVAIANAYTDSDLFLSASRSECFPLVILDAMASATPFVSTDVGCVRDLDGGVTVSRLADMPSAIRCLAEDASLRKELGRRGQRACGERFSWAAVGQQYIRLLGELTNERKPTA